MQRTLSALLAGVLVAAMPAAAPSQGPAFHIGRVFNDGGWTAFGVSWAQRPLGPLSLALGGTMLRGDGASTARLWGADAEVSLFRGGRPGAYAVGGVAGGFGTGGAESWWRSWSAGVGYELIPLPFLSLGVEGRYVGFGASARSGLELSFRVGANIGASPVRPPAIGGDLATASSTSAAVPLSSAATSLTRSDAQRLLDGVIATADSAIGARYRYGGTGEDGRGFDCSGLIQYAYARHGITLPRTSTAQATQGREIDRTLDALQPGDLLTFSSSGHGVTHVGLYVGNGRFIHSASTGVQTSTLSADDPYGKWWYTRWVGVRRIVEGAA